MFFSAKNVTEFNGVKVFMSHDDIKKMVTSKNTNNDTTFLYRRQII